MKLRELWDRMFAPKPEVSIHPVDWSDVECTVVTSDGVYAYDFQLNHVQIDEVCEEWDVRGVWRRSLTMDEIQAVYRGEEVEGNLIQNGRRV